MPEEDEPPLADLFDASGDDAVDDEASWSAVAGLTPTIEMQQGGCAAIWGSSLHLARWVASNTEAVSAKRVIELGGGVCLPSLVAAAVGAASVIGTDLDSHAVAALSRAIERNRVGDIVTAARLDWFDYLPTAPAPADALDDADVILAADVNYFSAAVPALLGTIGRLLRPGGVLLLASKEERVGLDDCVSRLQQPPLSLQLTLVATFDDETGGWHEAAAAGSDDAAAAAAEAGAPPHRMWRFSRPTGAEVVAGEASATGLAGLAAGPFLEPTSGAPYHERQSLMRCAVHALNNLAGRQAVSQAELDEIAISLGGSLSLSHRWPLLGNHDVNVIFLGLQRIGLEGEWWDTRRPEAALLAALGEGGPSAASPPREAVGAIVNVRSRYLGLFPSRHWLALRRVGGGLWEDADSKHHAPLRLRGAEALAARLRRAVAEEDGHVIIVRAQAEANLSR